MRLGLINAHHLAAISKIVVHVFNTHAVGLRSHVDNHFRFSAFVVVHGSLAKDGWEALRGVDVEIAAETVYTDAAEDTEYLALLFGEFYVLG
jgi:hypothetical protein